ncbi:L,D-transpeptidase [Streptomyces sp. NBC_01450]|uniref:L,D-transpeptidase n=1 Tax=Streptomyces sp. NBC_01450 TaxID=2903871 RepID=UPI002E2F1891|nr:L,D-transpeptidase [Streptomyces sp. NBC_01450]
MSDELASGLRELAQDAETPPSLSGAEIRLRAVRRRRFRRTAVTVAGACAAASLALVVALNLTGGDREDRPSPAASPTAPPSTPAPTRTPAGPVATVDLARRVLTVAGRELPISSGSVRYPTATGRMTVVTKEEMKAEPMFSGKYVEKVAWAIGLRAADGTTNVIGALTSDEKAPGNYDVTSGWIGLRREDAQWLYEQLAPGAAIEIEGASATPTATGLDPSESDGSVLPGGVGGTEASPGQTVGTPEPSVSVAPSVAAVPAG